MIFSCSVCHIFLEFLMHICWGNLRLVIFNILSTFVFIVQFLVSQIWVLRLLVCISQNTRIILRFVLAYSCATFSQQGLQDALSFFLCTFQEFMRCTIFFSHGFGRCHLDVLITFDCQQCKQIYRKKWRFFFLPLWYNHTEFNSTHFLCWAPTVF